MYRTASLMVLSEMYLLEILRCLISDMINITS